jgi:predicted ATP-grasp superfamily ATP-dependent carboligase
MVSPKITGKARNTRSPYAIIIGLDCFTGLQTARILARRSIPVIGIASNPKHACCRTRACDNVLVADTSSVDFIHSLETLGPQLGEAAVLYPCTDMSVLTISRHRRSLETWYRFALPPEDVVELLINKIRFYSHAQQVGFQVPTTFFLHSQEDVLEAARQLKFPCILKPPIRTPLWEKNTKTKAYSVKDAQDLLRVYELTSNWAESLMVQEWIEGPDSNLFSCNCYFTSESLPAVNFIARKIRQWPPKTGTSSLGEECRNDAVLQESIRFFQHFLFKGLGYLEIKLDARNGKYYIIEPNIGRPTGRSAITEAGGVELLYTMYCDLLGQPLPANREQQYTGVKWIYLRRDLQSAWSLWRQGELSLKQWRQSLQGRKYYALFSWTDPVPFLEDFRITFIKKVLGLNLTKKSPREIVNQRYHEEKRIL